MAQKIKPKPPKGWQMCIDSNDEMTHNGSEARVWRARDGWEWRGPAPEGSVGYYGKRRRIEGWEKTRKLAIEMALTQPYRLEKCQRCEQKIFDPYINKCKNWACQSFTNLNGRICPISTVSG